MPPRTTDVRGFSHPLGGQTFDYLAHQIDGDNDVQYYGFISHIGSWMIQRVTESTGEIRYSVGKQDFPTNWTNRDSLSYDYLNNAIS